MLRSLIITSLIALLVVLSAFAFTQSTPRADFTYVNTADIHTLDPARMSWTPDFRVALNIWEGLTTWDPETLAPIGAAAEFPPDISDDGLTYTFTIRDDARWSSGDAVTAGDFVRGWRRGLEPGTATDYTFLLTDHIAGADEYVKWRRRSSTMLTALARLADGRPLDPEQAQTLLTPPVAGEFRKMLALCYIELPPVPADSDWSRVAASLNQADMPWREVHRKILHLHAGSMDKAFGKAGIDAKDDRTLVVKLTQPAPYFLDLTGFPIFLPCHKSIEILRGGNGKLPITNEGLVVYDPQWTKPDYYRNDYPGLVTNGPYRLQSWTFKQRARLAVNPHHRLASDIGCRTVDMLVFESVASALLAYEAGDVDFLPDMNVSFDHELYRLAHTGERKDFHACRVSATMFFNFNCARDTVGGVKNPFTDPRVRKAFALAIDKESIVTNVLRRGDRVAHSFVPPESTPGYDPPEGLSHNAARARELLGEAGYPDGEGLPPIHFLYTPNDERVGQAVARMWEETLNVRIAPHSKESKTYAADKTAGRYMIARANWYADYNDPTTFLNCLATGNGNNDSGYSDDEYDRLLQHARGRRDKEDRFATLREAEAVILQRDVPIAPVLHYTTLIAIQPEVTGLHPNARLWFPFHRVQVNR